MEQHFFFKLFIYLWLCWVFVSVRGLSLVAASGGQSSLRCAGLSLSRPLLLRSTGSRRAGSVIVAHGPSCSAACGIFPDQGSNPCPLHWQADSQRLRHQGSPSNILDTKSMSLAVTHISLIRICPDNLSVVYFLRHFLPDDLTSPLIHSFLTHVPRHTGGLQGRYMCANPFSPLGSCVEPG